VRPSPFRVPYPRRSMSRPIKFEEFRYVGDKRTQRYYDLDDPNLDQDVIDELMASEQFICFGPDQPSEARNRGYQPA
jgi:hypothetical protein